MPILALLLILVCWPASAASPLHLDDSAEYQWRALLHIQGERLQIDDPTFLLSYPDFSPQRELQATLALLRNNPVAACRFPARYQFLLGLGFELPERPACPGFDIFLTRAPVDEVSLIYASENISSPTSMMGHAMLAISGTRADGHLAEHAVTFLTEIDTYNPFTLFYDTLMVGKEGFFLVQPLSAYYRFYLVKEQRPVWRYRIRFSDQQRSLLQAHIWELKQAHILYLFDTHNCATMALDLLALAYPEINQDVGVVSPLDVARIVEERQLVEDRQVLLSARWTARMLSDQLGEMGVDGVRQLLAEETVASTLDQGEQGFLVRQLTRSLSDYQYQTGALPELDWHRRRQWLATEADADWSLDVSQYRNPMASPQDSHIAAGWRRQQGKDWLTLSWLPAAHHHTDDNREFFAENELRFMEPVLGISEEGEVRLRQWQFLTARGWIPHDPLLGGLSGGLELGFQPIMDQQLQDHAGLRLFGNGGYTAALSPDLRLYALAGLGVETTMNDRYAYLQPELGGWLYEVWNMKSWWSWQSRLRLDHRPLQRWQFSQSLALGDQALILEASHWRGGEQRRTDVQLWWRWYY